jgi:hypothetical protein
LQLQCRTLEGKLAESQRAAVDQAKEEAWDALQWALDPLRRALEKCRQHMEPAGWEAVNNALRTVVRSVRTRSQR